MSQPASADRVVKLLAGLVVASVAAGVLVAGLAIPLVGAGGSLASNSVAYFDSLPSELAQEPLQEASKLVSADNKVIASFYDENRTQVSLAKMAPVMQHAIIAIEDNRFYEHGGVDPKGVLRAAVNNQLTNDVQGASTLTQQYVKNVLVENAAANEDTAAVDAAREVKASRKLREMKLAISLEKVMTKDQILQGYLNIALFGDNTYGVEAAAKYYFSTTAAKLTLPQAALLAGIVQRPTAYNPRLHLDAATQRRNTVLGKMRELNMISQADYEAAKADKPVLKISKPKNGCANAGPYGYFCDYVKRTIEGSDQFKALGANSEERHNALFRGGLTIKTTLVTSYQVAAKKAVDKGVAPDDPSHVSAASVTIEPGTGKVLTMTQNKDFNPDNSSAVNTTINYSTDSNMGASDGFQTGSTFKPFTLATWLAQGKSLNSYVSAAQRTYGPGDFTICNGQKLNALKSYSPANAGDGEGSGSMSVLQGTYNSVNTVYVNMESQLDLCDIAKTAESLGVHYAKPRSDECDASNDKLVTRIATCIPSMTLGPFNVAPITMAAAYAGFAAQGKYCAPIAVTAITDRTGKQVVAPTSQCKQAIDKDVANTVSYALTNVLTRGTAKAVGGIGRPAAGKTGTTNDSLDSWFVGYTPNRATAVWVGDPHLYKDKDTGQMVRHTMRNRKINGTYRSAVYGATIAAPIWKNIMKTATANVPKADFGEPSAKLLEGEKRTVPDVSGQSVDSAKSALQSAGFNPSVAGGQVPSGVPAGQVAFTSPGAGSSVAPGSGVQIVVSSGGSIQLPGQGNGNGNQDPGQAIQNFLNGLQPNRRN